MYSPSGRLSATSSMAAALVLLVLGGCAPQQAVYTGGVDWRARQQTLLALSHWRMSGKLAYRHPQSNGSAWYDWRQEGDSFTVLVSGPLGSGTAEINGSPGRVTLRRSDHEPLSSSSGARLSEHLFGMRLPIDSLPYWLRGIPSPAGEAQITAFNAEGAVSEMEQDQWRIVLSRYRDTALGQLPSRVEASQGDVSIRILVKDWVLTQIRPGG